MNEKKKIEVMKLYLIFGRERNKAFKMLMKGKSKQLKNQLLRQLVFSLVNRQFYGIISE